MKAVGLLRYLPIDNPESLMDIELPMPETIARDLLVRVHAIAVNPIDTKVRKPKDKVETQPKVLGWDAAGEVVQVGPECSLFKVGEHVYYSGEIGRPGSNAEYQLVDERLVGRMPQSLNYEQAAALPLTAVTAWESLFDRMGIAMGKAANQGKSILIIGGAGGVGSVAIQLAKQVAGLTVIATASRPETIAWVRELGAEHVVDHRKPLVPQLTELGLAQVDYILCNSDTDAYFDTMAELIKPQGKVCLLVDSVQPQNLTKFKMKSVTLVWESMFTRSLFRTPDMDEQHRILGWVTALVEQGLIRSTLKQVLSPINAANLRAAHAQLEAGSAIGKIVLSGWN
ncbi:MAG TPA: zinc-binding alcohol dehydrogenase family protein [Methylophilaceae bacterium]|jgi:zinc-binding alcohol dehydrogenase family protein